MAVPFIEFRGVSKQFGDNRVLERIDLQIYEGEVTTIIGLSGSGKSVLLKHIIGLLQPDEGEVLLQGKKLGSMTKTEQDRALSRISYMFQQNALFDSLTVYENIALPLREKTNLSRKEIEKRVMARIEQTELTQAAQRYPSELSGGMQKRAALARALVTDPTAVLFDEPTTGQDPVRKNAILSMIAQYQRKFGFTAILVSHEIPDVYFISNRILALYERKIVFQGPPEEFENFKHPFQDEVAASLEELQHQLTGIYSKRQFLMKNSFLRDRLRGEGKYTAFVYTIPTLKSATKNNGLSSLHPSLINLGLWIVDYLGNLGGFSTRVDLNEFITILPYSSLDEAEHILEGFLGDLNAKRFAGITTNQHGRSDSESPGRFCFRVGLAEGNTDVAITDVINAARSKQKEVILR